MLKKLLKKCQEVYKGSYERDHKGNNKKKLK